MSRRPWGLLLALGLSTDLGAQRSQRPDACLTLLDQQGQHPVVGAMVQPVTTGPMARMVAITDSAGRACIAGRDSIALRVDALGFIPVDLVLVTAGTPPLRLFTLPPDAIEPDWGRSQLRSALDEAVRQPEILRDTVARAVLNAVIRRADSVPPMVSVTHDSAGPIIVSYVDLSADGSHTSELRLRYTAGRSVVLGLTTRQCDASCAREFDVAVAWVPRERVGWIPDQLARKEASGEALVLALGQPVPTSPVDHAVTPSPAMAVAATPRSRTIVRGTVRDEKGRPVSGIEIYSADGTASTVSRTDGAYQLSVPMPPGGVLLTTRRIGFAPVFRTIRSDEGSTVTWDPSLKELTVLARQLVTATGVPEQLRAPRFSGFLERRAKGVGQFIMTEDIWSAVSLGDVLNRNRGFRAIYTFGNNLSAILVNQCGPPFAIGVYVDGMEETAFSGFQLDFPGITRQQRDENRNTAEKILPRYVTGAIAAMELYPTRVQIPPEFAKPQYCAVIALWTR